jgi:hypothetical protein
LEEDIAGFQAGLPEPAKIHFVGFQMKASDEAGAKKIVRRYRGRFRAVD